MCSSDLSICWGFGLLSPLGQGQVDGLGHAVLLLVVGEGPGGDGDVQGTALGAVPENIPLLFLTGLEFLRLVERLAVCGQGVDKGELVVLPVGEGENVVFLRYLFVGKAGIIGIGLLHRLRFGRWGGAAAVPTAAAACQLFGGTPSQIEYAAEMGLEHHLGLTCDPVCGLVQIPCIERNAVAAARALDANSYANLSDGHHMISYDRVVEVMKETGKDIPSLYRETSEGGLARNYTQK